MSYINNQIAQVTRRSALFLTFFFALVIVALMMSSCASENEQSAEYKSDVESIFVELKGAGKALAELEQVYTNDEISKDEFYAELDRLNSLTEATKDQLDNIDPPAHLLELHKKFQHSAEIMASATTELKGSNTYESIPDTKKEIINTQLNISRALKIYENTLETL